MSPAMKTTHAAPRNHTLVALYRRYGSTTTTMKDRRTPRGGARNKQRDYREEKF